MVIRKPLQRLEHIFGDYDVFRSPGNGCHRLPLMKRLLQVPARQKDFR
jgi:hypothetical protein